VVFADTLPILVLTLFAGAVADRVGYFRVMRLSVLGSALTTAAFAALTITGVITIAWVIALTLLFGSIEAITYPARMSAVNTLVPRRDLPSAIALGSTTFNGARILGPAIAGWMITVFGLGIGWVIATAAGSYFLLAAILFAIRAEETRGAGAATGMLRETIDGVKLVVRDPGIWFLMLVMGATGVFIRPYVELLSAFTALAFSGGPKELSLLLSLIGVGAMLGSLWLAWRGRIAGLTSFVGVTLAVMGACQVVFTMVDSIYLAGAFMAVSGFCMNGGSSASQTLIQSNVAHDVRARVLSVFVVISWGMPAFGAVAAGWIAEVAGIRATLAAGGVLSLALYLWARVRAKAAAKELEAAEATP
jgi:MFS family permease